jgi:GTP:adenosylcobinamide-phosphate guanylyltransferase
MSLTALLLAGSRPGADPLAATFGTPLKALIPVAGEPMIARPAKALRASDAVKQIIVVAQDPEALRSALPDDARLAFHASQSTIAGTLETLCDDPSVAWPLLVTTADHALLDKAMIAQFIERAGEADVATGVVERATLLRRFPNARRTWLKFRGGAYTGANLFLLKSPAVRSAVAMWRSVEQDRKKGLRLVARLGPLTLIGVALRLLTIDGALRRAGRKLGLDVRAVQLDDPCAGIDVDKLDDHALVEAIIGGRA